MNPGFWAGKRVLLTGHTGFKGSWLAVWLLRLGAKVSGYSLPAPTSPSLFELAGLRSRLDHRPGDVRDLAALRAAVDGIRPDVAIHLAAQPLVRRSYAEPLETYGTNVMGTVHFLEAVRLQPSVRAAVVVTTDKCYLNREDDAGYREDAPLGGYDPYSSSKACAELAVAAYRQSYFSKPGAPGLASARAGNVIGGGDWAQDRLIPDIVAAVGQGRNPEIRSPEAVRPWQHVLEPLSGYLLLAERLWQDPALYSGPWNFGPDRSDEKDVRWIVERLCGLWGDGRAWRPQPGEHPHETGVLRLDSGKARSSLGWRPRWNLERALRSIVEWHRAQAGGADAYALTQSQIEAYEASPLPLA